VVSEACAKCLTFSLDVNAAWYDGFDLCRQIRQSPTLSATPVIFLTAKTGEADRVKASNWRRRLRHQALQPRKLVARVRSVLRGMRQPPVTPEVLHVGDLVIDALR